MVTLFSIPKSFQGPTGILQRNALCSWLRLVPAGDVLLLGDDPGVAETAEEFGVIHVPGMETNEFGTPLLSAAYASAQERARNDLLLYVNADIILLPDCLTALKQIPRKPFLLSGCRWDLEVRQEIDFQDSAWGEKLAGRVRKEGILHGPYGMDYFIFRCHTVQMPPFAVGRPGWDTWLVHHMRKRKVPVIDATAAIMIVHQNHDFSHSRFGGKWDVGGPEKERNYHLAGGYDCMMSLRDADWVLDGDGLHRPAFPQRLYPLLSFFPPWRMLRNAKRRLDDWRECKRTRPRRPVSTDTESNGEG
jgi:hypothetical protein